MSSCSDIIVKADGWSWGDAEFNNPENRVNVRSGLR